MVPQLCMSLVSTSSDGAIQIKLPRAHEYGPQSQIKAKNIRQ